jgi:hypothetical protein
VIGFAAVFDGGQGPPGPYEMLARFRLVHAIQGETPLDHSDIERFLQWHSVSSAWPYWREHLASTLSRSQLPPLVVPTTIATTDARNDSSLLRHK